MIRIRSVGGGFVAVEGSREELERAGVLKPTDTLPRGLRGTVHRPGVTVTMISGGRLRVWGRRAKAAKADAGFQRWLESAAARRPDDAS